MPRFLILKLQGVMQSWGGHTYEDLRHTEVVPTRSALVGLLGACLGIERTDRERLAALNAAVAVTVRRDGRFLPRGQDGTTRPKQPLNVSRITDYHTIEGARTVKGTPRQHLTPTRREYLCDACFTVALSLNEAKGFTLQQLVQAVQRPRFTPFLGRRSCPISRPLYEGLQEGPDPIAALRAVEPHTGVVYAEDAFDGSNRMRLRDVDRYGRTRQFMTRDVYFRIDPPEDSAT